MTLGETREQISNLENELSQLKDEKHQLFLQLKKVLNEDDNRRRQLIKETKFVLYFSKDQVHNALAHFNGIFLLRSICSEVLTAAVAGYPGTGPRVVHPQVFLPLPRSSSPVYKVAVGVPTHTLLSSVSVRDFDSRRLLHYIVSLCFLRDP